MRRVFKRGRIGGARVSGGGFDAPACRAVFGVGLLPAVRYHPRMGRLSHAGIEPAFRRGRVHVRACAPPVLFRWLLPRRVLRLEATRVVSIRARPLRRRWPYRSRGPVGSGGESRVCLDGHAGGRLHRDWERRALYAVAKGVLPAWNLRCWLLPYDCKCLRGPAVLGGFARRLFRLSDYDERVRSPGVGWHPMGGGKRRSIRCVSCDARMGA